MWVKYRYFTSPDRSENPYYKKDNFSCPERATNGSSFQDLEKYFFLRKN